MRCCQVVVTATTTTAATATARGTIVVIVSHAQTSKEDSTNTEHWLPSTTASVAGLILA